MRARFFGADASTAHTTRALLERDPRRRSARSSSTSATPRASTRCSPSTRRELELVIHTAAQPSHDWAASDPQTDFARQRERHAQPARGDAPATRPSATFIFCSTNKVYGDLPNLLPLVELEHAPGAARRITATTAGSTRRCRSTLTHALAVRRLEGRGRPARAGVRALLRHADRLLPRRLPDRPQPRRARSCTASSPT